VRVIGQKSTEESRFWQAQAGSALPWRCHRELNTMLDAAKSGEQG
jgi:hypothetical protein